MPQRKTWCGREYRGDEAGTQPVETFREGTCDHLRSCVTGIRIARVWIPTKTVFSDKGKTMKENLLTTALLLTACGLVICAISLSWLEIQEYKHGVDRADVTMPETGGAPEPDTTPSGEDKGKETGSMNLVQFAPQNAFALISINVAQLATSDAWKTTPQLKNMAQSQMQSLESDAVDRAVFFVSPNPAGQDAEPITTGIMSLNVSPSKFENLMEKKSTGTEKVKNRTAYKSEGYYGVIVEDKVLMAKSVDSLSSMMERYESGEGEAPSKLTSALEQVSGSSIRFAAVPPGDMREKALQSVPENYKFMQDMNAVTGGVDLSGKAIKLDVDMEFAVAASAESAANVANEQLDGLKDQVSSMMEKMDEAGEKQKEMAEAVNRITDSFKIAADGKSLKVNANIQLEHVSKAMGFAMQQIMGGMMAGGGGKPETRTSKRRSGRRSAEEPKEEATKEKSTDTTDEEPLPALSKKQALSIIKKDAGIEVLEVMKENVAAKKLDRFYPTLQIVYVWARGQTGGRSMAQILLDKKSQKVVFERSGSVLPAPALKARFLKRKVEVQNSQDIKDLFGAYLTITAPQDGVQKVQQTSDTEYTVLVGKGDGPAKKKITVKVSDQGMVKDWNYAEE